MRVAVYAAPGTRSADPVARRLQERAQAWLGRGADGQHVASAWPTGWSRAGVDALTVQARRYGFHATLKAPFGLAPGRTLDELDQALAAFAAHRPIVTVPRLSLTRIGAFFALVPGDPAPDLDSLAHAVVVTFDGFRAPATEAEIARREPAALTPRQCELLLEWGYPYVLEEFRFHLTLTDQVLPSRQDEVEGVLRDWFSDSLDHDVPVDALALFTEPAPGAPFVLHSAHRMQPLRTAQSAARTATEGPR